MPGPSLEQVVQEAIAEALEQVHTCLPGRVESYDAATQTANVKPLVRLDGQSLPVLPNQPVLWLRGGGAFLSFPLAVGDFVFILFSEASIDQWRAKGGAETAPGDLRRHSLTGGAVLPALYPSSRKLTDASGTKVVLGFEGGIQLRVGSTAVEAGSGTVTDGVAKGPATDARIAQLRADLTTLKTAIAAGLTAVGVGAGANGPAGATAFNSAASAVPAPAATVTSTVLKSG